jgi:hypothetical protein
MNHNAIIHWQMTQSKYQHLPDLPEYSTYIATRYSCRGIRGALTSVLCQPVSRCSNESLACQQTTPKVVKIQTGHY